jgi:hypothetical protein
VSQVIGQATRLSPRVIGYLLFVIGSPAAELEVPIWHLKFFHSLRKSRKAEISAYQRFRISEF